jgi:hypothetical protein
MTTSVDSTAPTQADYVVTEKRRFRVAAQSEVLEGGQGTIDRLVGNQLAVKRPRSAAALKNWDPERALEVRRLPLEDLDISRPLLVLSDDTPGYVMQLIDGTLPIRSLIADAGAAAPEELLAAYHRAAGVRRRLRLLAGIAAVLARIHGRGLVYTDLSAGNVMVSERAPHENVWLVDVDNVAVAGTRSSAPFTPGFAPPELAAARLPSRLVDAYAFAVLAFRVLTQLHPLYGDEPAPGGPAGDGPWIEHETVRDHFADIGIPREHVMDAELRELFRLCFEDGLGDPDARPDLATWTRALFGAADGAVRCSCGRDRLGPGACGWCGAPLPPLLTAVLLDCVPGSPPKVTRGAHGALAVAPRGSTFIEERHRTGRLEDGPLQPVIAIDRSGDRLDVRAMSGRSCQLVRGSEKPQSIRRKSGRRIDPARPGHASDVVHLGPPDRYHRAVAIVADPRAVRA